MTGASRRRVLVQISQDLAGPDSDPAERLAVDLARLSGSDREVLVLLSGYLPSPAEALETDPESRRAEALKAQPIRSDRLRKALNRAGIDSLPLPVCGSDLAHRTRNLNFRNSLWSSLREVSIPILIPNHAVSTAEADQAGADRLAATLAPVTGADRFINLIPKETPAPSALESAHRIAAKGIEAALGRFSAEGDLERISRGAPPAILVKAQPRVFGPDYWEALTLASKGEIHISQQGLDRLNNRVGIQPSLVTRVKGRFEAGARINLIGPDGSVVGVGLSNWESSLLNRVKGLNPGDIKAQLGYNPATLVVQEENLSRPSGPGGAVCLIP